jgi:hypothetical protein
MALTTSMGQDTAGKLPGTSEEIASLKAWLFQAEDQQKATITILGDPDFLMTASYGSFDEMTGSIADEAPINSTKGAIFIEIDMKSVKDYGADGTMKPVSDYQFWVFNDEMEKQLQGRMLYMVNSVKSKFAKGVFTQEFTDLSVPPLEFSGKASTPAADAKSREGGTGTKKPSNGTSLDPAKAAQARRDFAAKDPRRLDLPRPTHHDNGKPILAPATSADDEKNLVGKGYSSAAQVFNKDAVQRDPVTLLPKRQQ